MRDTLLLDLGNVLVPFDYSRSARAFSALTGLDAQELKQILTGPRLHAICAGELQPAQLFDELATHSGRDLDSARAAQIWCDIFTPDAEMISFAGQLARKYRTFLWSNTDALHWAFLQPQLGCLPHFVDTHLSHELGAAKPDRAFYVRALERGGIDPSRAVFVDDIAANLETAAQFGIATVQHRSVCETAEALARLGFAP